MYYKFFAWKMTPILKVAVHFREIVKYLPKWHTRAGTPCGTWLYCGLGHIQQCDCWRPSDIRSQGISRDRPGPWISETTSFFYKGSSRQGQGFSISVNMVVKFWAFVNNIEVNIYLVSQSLYDCVITVMIVLTWTILKRRYISDMVYE